MLVILSASASAATVYESATFNVGIGPRYGVQNTQFLGSRFTIGETTAITAVGGHVWDEDGGTLFAAIVNLDPITNLPTALPTSLAFATNTVIASTVFTPPNTPTVDAIVPLTVTLSPGTYGLLFGSGYLGAARSGFDAAMPGANNDLPSASYFRLGANASNTPVWIDGGFSRTRFFVEGSVVATAVPLPSAAAAGLVLIGGILCVKRHRS